MTNTDMLNGILENFQGVIAFKDLEGRNIVCGKDTINLFKNESTLEDNPIGKTDHEIGLKFANDYRKNDLKVINSGKAELFPEKFGQGEKIVNSSTFKFPVLNNENKIIGVGVIVPGFHQ